MTLFSIITLFPDVIAPYANASMLGRAQKEKLIKIVGHDLRKFSKDKHRKVDDSPYGGGAGMVMMVQPMAFAIMIATVPIPEPPACTSTVSPGSNLALSNSMC